MLERFGFRPKARLLAQLGEQLIRNESVAVIELVKNSYDADASKVDIYLSVDPRDEYLSIEDNGTGMSKDVFVNNWLVPGTENKSKDFKDKKLTEKYKRLPIGEKGIGRFGVHKLGNKIEVVSKTSNAKECKLTIDWTELDDANFLEDFKVKIEESNVPQIFKGETTGTKIRISNLKKKWNKREIRELIRSINSLSSPFSKRTEFEVCFNVSDKSLKEDLYDWGDIKELAMFKFFAEIKGSQIEKFSYDFSPYEALDRVKSRSITETDKEVSKILKLFFKSKKEYRNIDLEKYDIGPVTLTGYIFDRDTYTLSLAKITDKKGFKEYLNKNSGIKIFRDDLRVYDYGEPGNDWLGLDLDRVNSPTKGLSNNLVIASVDLNRSDSEDLEEKTNREGFIENEAFFELREAVKYTLGIIQYLRYEDKRRLREVYQGIKSREPVLEPIRELKGLINKKIKLNKNKKEIMGLIDKVEKEYLEMKGVLLNTSASGLSLGIAIHEIEKIIAELVALVRTSKQDDHLDGLVMHLYNLVENYSDVIRTSGVKVVNLKDQIKTAMFNCHYRFEIHHVEVILSNSIENNNYTVKAPANMIISMLMNFFDNSIYWFHYGNVKKRKIFIDIERNDEMLSLSVLDNGPGFTIDPEDAKKVFVSGKSNGMGMGLHLANEIMKSIDGELIIDDFDFLSEEPRGFNRGALVSLVFKE